MTFGPRSKLTPLVCYDRAVAVLDGRVEGWRVGILRPDGETDAGADVLAMTVRTYYMPNPELRAICARGRALREAAGTLAGHAVGDAAGARLPDGRDENSC